MAIRWRIAGEGGGGRPFVNRSRNEASRKKMEQKDEQENTGKSEH
jgi:hypothetical protein